MDTPVGSQPDEPTRARARVEGFVQGVGFRPYVYHLAHELGLTGFVLNDTRGVLVEVEGSRAAVRRFLTRLPLEAPPLADVRRIEAEEVATSGEAAFRIVESEAGGRATALVSPDAATCGACLVELFDPADRRFRYPFINCTHCGPRFTIVRSIPYDRPNTTMAGFGMCDACRAEYEDPLDRRFHAQPNACPVCGPRVQLRDAAGGPVGSGEARDPVEAAARALVSGAIVAVKGLGGFHLACRADDPVAVATLRSRKHREDKPFALMAADVERARGLVELGDEEERLLVSRQRPIVLARRNPDAAVARAVAPGHRDLGVMLPYSPLHHLLLADTGLVLVMTSGNVSDEPIAYENEEAMDRLGGIADLFLLHDRPIETRTDDSVVRVVEVAGERRPLVLRRSRGYVPAPVDLPGLPEEEGPVVLACGAHLKNTFCLAAGRRAWPGPHIGDLENWETFLSYEGGIDHLERLLELEPGLLAHDLHPEYLSTRYALEHAEGRPTEGIQHHHAHLAACLAEHGEPGPALGVIYDGTGYGLDGTVWGGELLVGDLTEFRRVGHLWRVRLPGGEAAVREPWRMACAWLVALESEDGEAPTVPRALAREVDPARWRMVARLAREGLASPVTSSAGRLFDAVAALCGLRSRVTYEGQAAIELEMVADPETEGAYPLPLVDTDTPGPVDSGEIPGPESKEAPVVLDARALVRAVLADLEAGVSAATISTRFHRGLADGSARVAAELARQHGVDRVVLSGGVFQNVLLLERMAGRLSEAGLRVLVPTRVPPNDGGISLGQAACALARRET